MKTKPTTIQLTSRQALPARAGRCTAALLHYSNFATTPALTCGHHVRHAAAALADGALVDPRGLLAPLHLTRRERALARLLLRQQRHAAKGGAA